MGNQARPSSPLPPIARHLEDIIVPFEDSEPLPPTSPERHHHMSASCHHPINILQWTDEHFDDPATRVHHL